MRTNVNPVSSDIGQRLCGFKIGPRSLGQSLLSGHFTECFNILTQQAPDTEVHRAALEEMTGYVCLLFGSP